MVALTILFFTLIAVANASVLRSANDLRQIKFTQHARSPADLAKFRDTPYPNFSGKQSTCIQEAGAKGSGQLPNYPCNTFHFHLSLLNISVGTPRQQVTLTVDSFGENTWIFTPKFLYHNKEQRFYDPRLVSIFIIKTYIFVYSKSSTSRIRLDDTLYVDNGEIFVHGNYLHDTYQV